jgi:anti-sigma regulatory factor (Ser/Thr protein kinase)
MIRECVEYVETRFRLDNDCSRVAPLVRHLQEQLAEMDLCDDTAVMQVGVALEEALTNAIQHGNLELESELFDTSLELFAAELRDRPKQPPYRDRRVEVTAVVTRQEARYIIEDEGPGFDLSIIGHLNELLAGDETHGRGLVLIHSVMDDVSYNEAGNQITMVKRRSL